MSLSNVMKKFLSHLSRAGDFLAQAVQDHENRLNNFTVSSVKPVPYGTPAFMLILHKDMVAGTPGTPDDVVIIAAGAYPYKIRVFECDYVVATAIPASSVQVRDAVGGAGNTLSGVLSTAATGISWDTRDFDTKVVNLATTPLILRRSDRGVAGEVFMHVALEP